jgi:exonuclease III
MQPLMWKEILVQVTVETTIPKQRFAKLSYPKRGLRIGEWNINHLTDAKFERINLLLTTSTNIDILFVIETFLKPSKPDSLFNIPGYYMYRKDRLGRKNGGGLLTYVAEKVQTNRVSELDEDSVESLWLTVCPHNSKRLILVGGVYRPPSTDKEHDLKIEQNIEMAYLRKQEMIIVGDFNINALDSRLYSKQCLIKSLKSMHLTQLVSTITRPASKTCLDHVYTSHPNFATDVVFFFVVFFFNNLTINKIEGQDNGTEVPN